MGREIDLLQQLSVLSVVELQKVNWCLSQKVLQDFPPIPPDWLGSSKASHTVKTKVRCYQEEGAKKILTEILRLMKPHSYECRFHIVAPPINSQAPKADFDPDFVRTHRRELISRMQCPIDVLNVLKYRQILNAANKEVISIFAGLKNKNRALVDLVLSMGEEAQNIFCQALSQSEPFLFHDLDHHPISDKVSSLITIAVVVSQSYK
uniref:CARD domain-containing protein n=1 Tax=Sphaeramia orbicularis TaxID=375764 RepID=A0A672ZKA0_9TELE